MTGTGGATDGLLRQAASGRNSGRRFCRLRLRGRRRFHNRHRLHNRRRFGRRQAVLCRGGRVHRGRGLAVDQVVEQMAELLQHVAQRRLRAGDAMHLLLGERIDRRQFVGGADLVQHRPQSGLNDAAHQLRRRALQPQRLDGAVAGHVDGVVEPVLDVAVQRRHEAIPQAALREHQEAHAVDLVHGVNDAGEERLGTAPAVVGAAGQQQILQLVERDHHRNLQAQEDLHQLLEQRQHQVLPARPHLEIQLREAVGQEVGQVRLVAQQRRPREALAHAGGASGRRCCAPRCAPRAGTAPRRRAPVTLHCHCKRAAPAWRRRAASPAAPAGRSATASAPAPATCPGPACAPSRPAPALGTTPVARPGSEPLSARAAVGGTAPRRRTPAAACRADGRRRAACRSPGTANIPGIPCPSGRCPASPAAARRPRRRA